MKSLEEYTTMTPSKKLRLIILINKILRIKHILKTMR